MLYGFPLWRGLEHATRYSEAPVHKAPDRERPDDLFRPRGKGPFEYETVPPIYQKVTPFIDRIFDPSTRCLQEDGAVPGKLNVQRRRRSLLLEPGNWNLESGLR